MRRGESTMIINNTWQNSILWLNLDARIWDNCAL
ncbi:hypothetical protein IMSAGC002_04406 [Lachnospiraceae bacterium]|nr:hypothetical protein IMSAGC002_04406 [Lachnospiraceae bacterium]